MGVSFIHGSKDSLGGRLGALPTRSIEQCSLKLTTTPQREKAPQGKGFHAGIQCATTYSA